MDGDLKLRKHLGDGSRAEGYEALVDLTRRMIAKHKAERDGYDSDQSSVTRLTELFLVAAVEGLNEQQGKVDGATAIYHLGVAAGTACISAAVSPMKDEILDDPEAMAEVANLLMRSFSSGFEAAITTWTAPSRPTLSHGGE